MTTEDVRFLTSPEGRALLEGASSSGGDPLRLQARLRRHCSAARARVVAEQVALRERAAAKFERAGDMLFDREALEQASGSLVAFHRARRYRRFARVADLCCGIGGDSLALAARARVVALDRRPERVALARWNARVYGREIDAVCADVPATVPPAGALFWDPSRRAGPGRRRSVSLVHYAPPGDLAALRRASPHLGVKVGPGLPHGEIPADCEAEFLSVHGQCRELVLWFGGLKSGTRRRATCLPSGASLVEEPVDPPSVAPVGRYLYEPDRAVIRAHLIDRLAARIGAGLVEPDVAYLTSDREVSTPFARRFEVRERMPFQLKRLRAWLRDRRIGRLDIKKRRFPMEPDDLRKALRPTGERSAALVCTRISGRPVVLVCDISGP